MAETSPAATASAPSCTAGARRSNCSFACSAPLSTARFRNASAYASWLGLYSENKISSGKVLYSKSRRVKSRVASALRMAANSLHHSKGYLGEFFRRITRKLGKPQAITATAHKRARIVYHLLTTKEAYDESVFRGGSQHGISVLLRIDSAGFP